MDSTGQKRKLPRNGLSFDPNLREFLRPEFIGRIDEIIVFNKLTKDDYAKIAGLMLNEMKEPLLEKQITLNVTEDACKLIAEKAYGKTYGAREIRRVIRQEVETRLQNASFTTPTRCVH